MLRALVLVIGLSAVAAAQTGDSAKLFEEGRALAKDGKWAEACDKFEQSLKLDHAIGTQLNDADCHEHLGHLAQAWRLFDAAAQASDKEGNAERSKFARQRAEALLLKVGTVVVKLADPDVPGMTLSIADRPTKPAAEVREIVDPGTVAVDVTAPSLAPIHKRARVDGGKTIVIEIAALGQQARHEEAPPTTERRKSRVITAYAVAGIGGAGGIAGIVLGVIAKQRYQAEIDNGNCNPTCNPVGFAKQSDAIKLSDVGTGFGVGGIVLISVGAVLFFTAPRDVVVTPVASTQSAGLAVVGRF